MSIGLTILFATWGTEILMLLASVIASKFKSSLNWVFWIRCFVILTVIGTCGVAIGFVEGIIALINLLI